MTPKTLQNVVVFLVWLLLQILSCLLSFLHAGLYEAHSHLESLHWFFLSPEAFLLTSGGTSLSFARLCSNATFLIKPTRSPL